MPPNIPELVAMPTGFYDMVTYAIAAAGFAFFAYFVYSWNSKGEVSARYRPAVLAGLCIAGIAFLSYVILFVTWQSGFDLRGGVYVPNAQARADIFPRYIDWTVTVPLLTAELLAVCSLAGAKARNLRFTTMTSAFLMIITGFFGSQVFAEGRSTFWLVLWGLVSTAFYVYLYVALIGAVKTSLSTMGTEAGRSLRNAATVLLGTFGVYPLVYAIPVFFHVTPQWLLTIQLAYSAADVLAKVGFGVLVHKVAKLRTAEDVAAGVETHPESIWVSNVKHSDGVLPRLAQVSPEVWSDARARFSGNSVVEPEPEHAHERSTVGATAPAVDGVRSRATRD